MKKYWAELMGTYIMVFAGTGAIIVNDIYGSGQGQPMNDQGFPGATYDQGDWGSGFDQGMRR